MPIKGDIKPNCSKCGRSKHEEPELFGFESSGTIKSICKLCRTKSEIERKSKMSLEQISQFKQKQLDWVERNHNHISLYKRALKFETTIEEVQKFLDSHDNKCDICDSVDNLHIDHDSTTGQIRGLLCRNHNLGIGFFHDDIKSLYNAIDYLTKTFSGVGWCV